MAARYSLQHMSKEEASHTKEGKFFRGLAASTFMGPNDLMISGVNNPMTRVSVSPIQTKNPY